MNESMVTMEGDALVDQNVCVLGGPSWLLAFVLESVAKRIRPGERQLPPDGGRGKGHRTIYFDIAVVHVSHPSSD